MINIDALKADPEFQALPQQEQAAHLAEAEKRNKATAAPTPEGPKRTWKGEILPVGGAVVGGTLGGLSPVPGGAIAGTAAGAAAGEAAQQGIERLMGQRQAMSPSEIAKTGVEQGAMEAVGGPILRAVGRMVKPAAARAIEAVIPRSAYQAKLVQAYRAANPFWQRVLSAIGGAPKVEPRTAAQTILDQKLMGGEQALGIQAKRASQSLWNHMIEPELDKSTYQVDMPAFFDTIEQRIIKETPELNRQQDLLEGLKALREPYDKGAKQIPLADLQKLKEGWAEFVPEKAYLGKPIAGAYNDVKDRAADLARQTIYDQLGPEVKQAYFDYGNLHGIVEHGKRAMTGGARKGGFGGFWSSIKDMAVTPVATVGGQVVYRTGQGLEMVGAPGARVVRDIVPGLTDIGKDISGKPAGQPQTQPAPTAQPQPMPTPTPQPSSPAMKQAYTLSAQHTLGGPDADAQDVQTVAALHRDVATGKTPDVQKDLRTGRLSIPAVQETLKKLTPRNAGKELEYMGPDDAVVMLRTAKPEDQQWLEPLVRQKLQGIVANPKAAPFIKKQTMELLSELGG